MSSSVTYPSRDSESDKYPERVFYAGRWRTQASIEVKKATDKRHRATGKGLATKRDGHRRWRATPKGRSAIKEKDGRRIRVLGQTIYAPNMETRERMRQLRDDYKESHG